MLLALLFLVGQYGPPVADMLASHPSGDNQAHVETSHSKTCHTERCMLGYVAPTAHVAALVPAPARLAMPTLVRGISQSRFTPVRFDRFSLSQPRAPPASV